MARPGWSAARLAFVTSGAILAVALAAADCGGKAIVDPDVGVGGTGAADGGGGASTTDSTTSCGPAPTTVTTVTTDTVSSTSSGTVLCTNFFDCCVELCEILNGGLCPVGDCGCDAPPGPEPCTDAITLWHSCLISNHPQSITCSMDQPLPACGPCDDELSMVEESCGGGVACF